MIKKIFKICRAGVLEKIALGDSQQKEERLRKIVLSGLSVDRIGLDPKDAFKIYMKHSVTLFSNEIKLLTDHVVKHASRYDLEELDDASPELHLLWAKKHAEEEPKKAYQIFTQQGYNGEEVIVAVQVGLDSNYKYQEQALKVSEISEAHLREAYTSAPFGIKREIALHLGDSKALKKLSREAKKVGN